MGIASKGEITWECEDGTKGSLGFQLPGDVLEQILCNIIEWKDNYLTTASNHEKYLDALNKQA